MNTPEIKVVSRPRKPISPARKRKLAKERELWESYGLQKPPKPRYSGLQGILWYLTSKLVRMQDFAKYGGLCVDGCGMRVERWQDADCGHFQTTGRAGTRFMRQNLALQTRQCNTKQRQGDARHFTFGQEIDRRWGEGTANRIIEISEKLHKIDDEWVKNQIDLTLKELSALTSK